LKCWGDGIGYLIQDFKNFRIKLSKVAEFISAKLLTVHVIQRAGTNTHEAKMLAILLSRC
jgi:hypothetical protein